MKTKVVLRKEAVRLHLEGVSKTEADEVATRLKDAGADVEIA